MNPTEKKPRNELSQKELGPELRLYYVFEVELFPELFQGTFFPGGIISGNIFSRWDYFWDYFFQVGLFL